jgi:hypothetical protein
MTAPSFANVSVAPDDGAIVNVFGPIPDENGSKFNDAPVATIIALVPIAWSVVALVQILVPVIVT